ncbi:MAG: hypothetical protein H6853_06920 [Rhodospirillales bacterium]|nr:hypothetical protein [Alphaproteobacteria bacterium]USO03259.1 MAG: hypothetical protein H6853_06920 [Rhodospirillales bacterium]
MFSAAGKEDGQILFGDSGFNMALTDEGAFVPYTYAAETPAQRKFYFRCYPDSRATPVQSFLTVTGMHEEHMDEQEAVARYSQAPKIDFHLKRG